MNEQTTNYSIQNIIGKNTSIINRNVVHIYWYARSNGGSIGTSSTNLSSNTMALTAIYRKKKSSCIEYPAADKLTIL